jgi:hypothetical protein
MERKTDAWSVILKDPELRNELSRIESQVQEPEALTSELLALFYRVDHLIKLTTHLICEEVC